MNKLQIIEEFALGKEQLLKMYKNILLSRRLDDTEIKMKKQGTAFFQISGAGHEGILTALAQHIDPQKDFSMLYYRDRAYCLALGVTPYEMLCQANGNQGDTASGARQMPAHWAFKKYNILPKSSCTGTQFLQAVGAAEVGRYLQGLAEDVEIPYHQDEIVVVSSGDGTIAQGEFWEALTTACVQKLPVLFLIEDNGYAISVPSEVQVPGGSISEALQGFPHLKIFNCDGCCPLESYRESSRAVNYLRSGQGPAILHAQVTRPYSHSLSDDHRYYRTEEELSAENQRDVVSTFPEFLISEGLISEEDKLDLIQEVEEEIKNAHDRAINTPWPNKESYAEHMYSSEIFPNDPQFDVEPDFSSGEENMPMAQGINRVLKSEVGKDPKIRIFGEDVADFSQLQKLEDESLAGKGGVFKVTSGVQRIARPSQVFNSPLAEANIVGRAIGMAYRGLRPIVEIQFFDYIWTAFMQLRNELATTRYRSGGQYENPVIVRVPIGGYLRGGAMYHSQSGESTFTHIPGLLVAYPSNALDAIGLLRTATKLRDPVLFLEHKHLYYQGYNRTTYAGDDYTVPFGKARIVREGKDATIVTWGALVQKSIDAVKTIEREREVSVEIIDLRTLAPLDFDAIKKSLKKTHRILVCHEEVRTSGYAGEIAARINEECFEELDAPVYRVTAKDTHVAYCPDLEEVILPQVDDIKNKLQELLDY